MTCLVYPAVMSVRVGGSLSMSGGVCLVGALEYRALGVPKRSVSMCPGRGHGLRVSGVCRGSARWSPSPLLNLQGAEKQRFPGCLRVKRQSTLASPGPHQKPCARKGEASRAIWGSARRSRSPLLNLQGAEKQRIRGCLRVKRQPAIASPGPHQNPCPRKGEASLAIWVV